MGVNISEPSPECPQWPKLRDRGPQGGETEPTQVAFPGVSTLPPVPGTETVKVAFLNLSQFPSRQPCHRPGL